VVYIRICLDNKIHYIRQTFVSTLKCFFFLFEKYVKLKVIFFNITSLLKSNFLIKTSVLKGIKTSWLKGTILNPKNVLQVKRNQNSNITYHTNGVASLHGICAFSCEPMGCLTAMPLPRLSRSRN
jgi:hypothetical protein